MQIYFLNTIDNNQLVLKNGEHQHISKVMRTSIGSEVYITNGKGKLIKAVIYNIEKKETHLLLKEVIVDVEQNTNKLSIAISPTKNRDRIEWFVEKAVELGINSIQFFYSKYSERKKINLERIKKIAIAALKQSKSLYLPTIKELDTLEDVFKENVDLRYIAYMNEDKKLFSNELKSLSKDKSIQLLIGPEGGFTIEEYNEAVKNRFISVSLGKNRLRTETAALYSVAAYKAIVHD